MGRSRCHAAHAPSMGWNWDREPRLGPEAGGCSSCGKTERGDGAYGVGISGISRCRSSMKGHRIGVVGQLEESIESRDPSRWL